MGLRRIEVSVKLIYRWVIIILGIMFIFFVNRKDCRSFVEFLGFWETFLVG